MSELKPIQLTNDEADLRLMIVESEFDFTSIFEEIQCDGGVYTDISNEGADHLARLFSGMFERLSEAKDAELDCVTAQRDALRKAVEHYADKDNWCESQHEDNVELDITWYIGADNEGRKYGWTVAAEALEATGGEK